MPRFGKTAPVRNSTMTGARLPDAVSGRGTSRSLETIWKATKEGQQH